MNTSNKRMNVAWAFIIFTGAAAVFLLLRLDPAVRDVMENGGETRGRMVQMEKAYDKNGSMERCHPLFEYQANDGRIRSMRLSTDVPCDKYPVGYFISLKYDKKNPSMVLINEDEYIWGYRRWIAGAVTALILIFGSLRLLRKTSFFR